MSFAQPIGTGLQALDSDSTRVVIGAGLLLSISFGTAYAIPAFFPFLIQSLDIPSWHLTALFSATGAVYFLLGVVIGPAADRIGSRRITMVGQFSLAVGLILIGFARNELAFEVAYLLSVGIGVGLCYVPAMGAVQVACQRTPALAGGLAASGIGLGTLVEPPLVQGMIDYVGWRGALQVMSLLAVCGILAARLLAKPEGSSRNQAAASPNRPLPLRQLLTSDHFALLYLAQLLVAIVAFVPFAHLVLLAMAKGVSADVGTFLIGLIGLGSLCGRVLLGCIAEAGGSCRSAAICAVVMGVALAGLALFPDPWELGCDAVLYGLGYGGVIGLLAPVVSEILGTRGICRSLGWVTTSRAVGILIGPWAVGVFAYWLGSYTLPFLSCALLALIAALLLEKLHRARSALAIHLAPMPAAYAVCPNSGLFQQPIKEETNSP
jgi:MFS family permease